MLSVSAFGQLDITKRNVTATQGIKAGTRLVIANDTVFAIQSDTTGMYAVNGKYFLCTVKTLQDYVAAHSGGSVFASNGLYKDGDTIKLNGEVASLTSLYTNSETNTASITWSRHAVLDRTYLTLSNMGVTANFNETGIQFTSLDTSNLTGTSAITKDYLNFKLANFSGGVTPDSSWLSGRFGSSNVWDTIGDFGLKMYQLSEGQPVLKTHLNPGTLYTYSNTTNFSYLQPTRLAFRKDSSTYVKYRAINCTKDSIWFSHGFSGNEVSDFSVDTTGKTRVKSISIGGAAPVDTTYDMDSINFPYTIFFQADGNDPVDDQTVYFCSTPQQPATNENNRAVIILQSGTITRAALIMNTTAGNAGTNEAISLYIRVNHTTDYLVKTLSSTSGTRLFDNYSLSIPVTQGDIIEMKVDPGTWATNPTSVHWSGNILIR